ncbi:MAG: hypothetical protein ACOYN9_12945 [Saprospiraceae bacterium]
MGVNAAKLEPGKDQTTPKSLIQQDSISQNKNQEVNQENPRLKQLKALQQMADASPQTEKLRTYQAMAFQQAAQRKKQIPVNDEKHLENEADAMGARALSIGGNAKVEGNLNNSPTQLITPSPTPVQKVENENTTDIQEEAVKPEMDLEKKPELADAVETVASDTAAANTNPDENQDKPPEEKGEEIDNSYNKSGFITEKASLRKTDVVNTIIESNKKDKKNAAKIIKSGALPKDKGWFGLGILGVKTEKFELSDNFDPKKLKYLIPVKIDQANEDKEIGWTPVQINYDFNDTAKQKLSVYKDEEGYVDSKKLIKSELDLNEKGTALTGKDNALGAAMNDSLLGKIAGFAVNNSKTVRGMANDAVDGAFDMFNKGAAFIQENALDKVEILKGLSFGLDKEASKITTQGSFITGKVAKDKWVFSATFKVNTQGDYSAEYMGSVIENPPELNLEGEKAGFKLNFGSMVKHQANAADPSIISKGGNASFQIMGQEVFAKWNQLDFNLNEKKVTSADFSEVGMNLNLSVGETIKVENLTAAVKDLKISNNTLTHGDITLSIASINLFGVATFSDIKGSIGQKTGFSGEGNFDVNKEGLAGAKGKVSVNKGPDDKVTKYKLQDGEFSAIIMGQEVSFKGVNYDSVNPNEISADSSSLKLNFSLGDVLKVDEFDATVSNAKLAKDKGFTYENISVNIASVSVFDDVAKFSNISGNVNPKEGFNAEGDFLVAAPNLANASGKVSVKKGPADLTTHYKLDDGSFNATILGQEVSITGVTYDSLNPHEISAASSNLKLNFSAGNILKVEAFDATLTDAKLTGAGFSYQDITVNIASVNVMDIAAFSDINGNVTADGGFNGSGNFNVTLPGLGSGQGKVSVKKGAKDEKTQYTLKDGAFNAEMVGQKASVTGVSYDSATNIFSIQKGELDVNIMGVNLNIVIQNPSFTKANGFDFASATATIPELVFADQAKMANIVVNVVKDGDKYTYDGSSDFNLSGEIDGASASANGNVGISKEEGEGPSLSFSNANVTLIIYGQSLELKNMSYKDGEFKAEKTVAIITPPFLKNNLQITVSDLSINKEGYSMSKSELETQLEVDFGILKGNLAKLALEKTSDSWIVSGEGGLAAGGTDFFGYKIPKVEGSGALSHDFGKKETKKELNGVSATLPDLEFPGSLFPGSIGVDAEIPVLPGLNVVASAGMEGKVTIPGLQLRVNKKEDQVYVISAGTQNEKPAKGGVKLFVAIGVGTGIPLIATVSLSIRAEGGPEVNFTFNVSKEISLNDNSNGLNLDMKSMETTYKMTGDLSLAAFLELKATAFYFFKKSYKKKLVDKSFGGFEVSDEEKFKWITPSEPLETDEEIESDMKDGLKINLNFVEENIWTKAKFVDVSSGFFKGDRKRVLVVDSALAAFDKVRGKSISPDVKVHALKKLEIEIGHYLDKTKGTSSRTKEVQTLHKQVKDAIKSLRAKIDKKLIDVPT